MTYQIDNRENTGRIFPEKAAPELIIRRKISVLRVRMSEAEEKENYEEAAKLRNDIALLEKGECTGGN